MKKQINLSNFSLNCLTLWTDVINKNMADFSPNQQCVTYKRESEHHNLFGHSDECVYASTYTMLKKGGPPIE